MSDIVVQKRIIKAISLSINESGILFVHDYGEISFSWDSISHVFAVIQERKNAPGLVLILLLARDSQDIHCVDGNATTLKNFKGIRPPEFYKSQYQSIPELRKAREEDLIRAIREICSHLHAAYVGKPLVEFLNGSRAFLPVFSKLRDIIEYCKRASEQVTEDDMKGASALDEEEELPVVSISRPEREEWKEGSLLEGRYTVQQILRGAMGTVYIVFDSVNARYYAMKTFQEKHLWDKEVVRRFIKEAEIWINLERHPNIVQAELVKEIEGRHYILLEYIQGTDLEELMQNEPLSLARAVEFGIQFCSGMDYAFKKVGLIHRDIKPSNCLITREGVLKITDFGLGKIFDETPAEFGLISVPQEIRARRLPTSTSDTTTLIGTLAFMAPELFVNIKSAGIRTDIYAFGVVLYIMITGVNPFFSPDPLVIIDNHLTKDPAPPGSINVDIPERLSKVTLRCIRKDPEERYENFEQIRVELEEIYIKLSGSPYKFPQIEDFFTEEDWLNKGLSLASLNRHKEAVLNFEQALKVNPEFTTARIHMASSLIQLKKTGEALVCIDEALRRDQENWKIWFYKGEALWKSGNTEEALKCFDRALENSDDKGTILGRKGKLYFEAGNLKEAQSFYDRALSQNPRSADTWDDMANLYITLNSYEAAMSCLEKSLEINPRSEHALYHQGIALFNMGCFSEAVRALQKALTINPDFPDSWLYIGDCYRESGHRQKALEAYRTALEIQPENIEAYLSGILLLKENRQLEEALRFTDRALKSAPDNTELLFHRAEILFELGYFEESRDHCRRVQELDPGNLHTLLLVNTATKWIEEQDALIERISSTAPLTREYCTRNIDTLLSVFCDSRAALAYVEENLEGSPHESYLRACLYFLEGDSEKSQECAIAALDDPGLNDSALRLKVLIEEQKEREGRLSGRKQGLLDSLFKKKGRETEKLRSTPDELLLGGIEKLGKNMFREARESLRSACSLDPQQAACVYFLGKTYEREGDLESARQCYDNFFHACPRSIGYLKDILLKGLIAQPQEKENMFQQFIGSFPGDYRQWILYMRYLLKTKRYEKVRLIASRLLTQSSLLKRREDPQFWNFRGFLQLFLSRNEAARGSFTKALEHKGVNPGVLLCLAKSYEQDGLYDQALQELAPIIQSGDQEIAACMMADIVEKQGFSKKPLQTIESALEKKPDSLILLYKKAQLLYNLKDFVNFFNLCNEIGALDPAFVPIKVLRAMSLIEAGQKIHDAFAELQNIIHYESDNLVAIRNLGFTYLISQNASKSMKIFDNILSLYTLDHNVYMGKGIASYMLGDYRMAYENFFQAAQLDHMDPDLWQFMGAVNFHLKNFDESRQCWDRALRYRSGFLQAWINKGNFLYSRGEFIQAQELANRALRINPRDFSAWILRSRCQWKRGELKEALRSAERSLSISPENAGGWVLRGILEFHHKNYELSLRSFEKGSTFESKHAELWFNRALVGMHLKNQSEARKSVERALALNPNHFASLIVRFFLEKEFGDPASAKAFLLRAQRLDPEKFLVWFSEYEQSRQPLSLLIPLELVGDPFILPFERPMSLIEPIELIDLLER